MLLEEEGKNVDPLLYRTVKYAASAETFKYLDHQQKRSNTWNISRNVQIPGTLNVRIIPD